MTQQKITAENAVGIIESAFVPFRCVAEPWDYGHRIRFRVFDNADDPVLTVGELIKNQFADANSLSTTINSCRATLIARGYELNDWALPTTMSR
jgi:hypothetical protein